MSQQELLFPNGPSGRCAVQPFLAGIKKGFKSKQSQEGTCSFQYFLTGTFCTRFLFNFFRSYVESLVTFSLVTHFYLVHFNRKRAAVPVKSQVTHAPYHRVVEEVEGKQ